MEKNDEYQMERNNEHSVPSDDEHARMDQLEIRALCGDSAALDLMGWVTILVELLGGLAVLVGAFVPLASVPMAASLLVAILTVQLPYGFSSIKLQAVTAAGPQFGPPGYEVNLLYLACLTTLVLGGSGPFAVGSILATLKA